MPPPASQNALADVRLASARRHHSSGRTYEKSWSVLGFGIAYNHVLNALSPPGTAVGIDVPHLWSWLFAALIFSVGLGLAIVRNWPTKRIPIR
jgi:hypothetical protein